MIQIDGAEHNVSQITAFVLHLADNHTGGLAEERHVHLPTPPSVPEVTLTSEPAGILDDVLAYILLLITVSGGDFKSDATKWWSKSTRLALSLKLHREDEPCAELGMSACSNPLCRSNENRSQNTRLRSSRAS